MTCPKCKAELVLTGTATQYGEIDVATGTESKPFEQQFFSCSSCNKLFTSLDGKTVTLLVAPRKTADQLAVEAKQQAQKEKARQYRLQREARIKAKKDAEKKALFDHINKDHGMVKAVVVEGNSSRKKLTEEERQERARARARKYARERYQRLKQAE